MAQCNHETTKIDLINNDGANLRVCLASKAGYPGWFDVHVYTDDGFLCAPVRFKLDNRLQMQRINVGGAPVPNFLRLDDDGSGRIKDESNG